MTRPIKAAIGPSVLLILLLTASLAPAQLPPTGPRVQPGAIEERKAKDTIQEMRERMREDVSRRRLEKARDDASDEPAAAEAAAEGEEGPAEAPESPEPPDVTPPAEPEPAAPAEPGPSPVEAPEEAPEETPAEQPPARGAVDVFSAPESSSTGFVRGGGGDDEGADTPLVSLPFIKAVPMGIIVDEFQTQTGLSLKVRGKAGAVETPIHGDNMTPEEFLNKLSEPNQLIWRKVKGGYELWDQATFMQQVLPSMTEQKVFIPRFISSTDLANAIKNANILTPNVGSVTEDQRTNQVIVTDVPEKLALVQDLINLLDVEQVTRVFRIKYANIEDVVEKISEFKSEPGMIDSDPLLGIIIVRDLQANINRMESLIEVLDIRQVRKVYNINSIGFEGDGADVLQENLEQIATEGAYFFIDDDRGLLYLEDREEVHDELEEFLRVFDRPIEQVLIQAELLDVKQNNDMTYGMQLQYSADLDQALEQGILDAFGETFSTITDSDTDDTETEIRGTEPIDSSSSGFGFVDSIKDKYPILSSGAQGLSGKYIGPYVKAELQAVLRDSSTRVLLRPRLIVKNGESAIVSAETENPLANLNYNTQYSSRSAISVSSVSSGLRIELEPSITPTGLIEMSVYFENSSADPVTLTTGDEDFQQVQAYRIVRDKAETVLTIPDGETRVIGGLISRSETDNKSGVPFLMSIPWIGPLLFGQKENIDNTRNLLFFITPTVVRERARGDLVVYEFTDRGAPDRWLDADIIDQYAPDREDEIVGAAPTGDMQPVEPAAGDMAWDDAVEALPGEFRDVYRDAPPEPDRVPPPPSAEDLPIGEEGAAAPEPGASEIGAAERRFSAPTPDESVIEIERIDSDEAPETANDADGVRAFISGSQVSLPDSLEASEGQTTNFVQPKAQPGFHTSSGGGAAPSKAQPAAGAARPPKVRPTPRKVIRPPNRVRQPATPPTTAQPNAPQILTPDQPVQSVDSPQPATPPQPGVPTRP